MFDDLDDFGGGCMSIHIVSSGKSTKGFPYESDEGFSGPTNHQALYQRERYERQNPEFFEALNNTNIPGRELQSDRGHIQIAGQGPYFPHIY